MPGWDALFDAWSLVEVDLHQHFGVDLDDLPARSWRWLRARVFGLLSDPATRTYRATVRPAQNVRR